MKKLQDAVTAHNEAVAALERACEAIAEAGDDADLDALQASFDEANDRVVEAKTDYDRLKAVADARATHQPIQVDSDEPEARDGDGNPVVRDGSRPIGFAFRSGQFGTPERPKIRVTKEPLTYERFGPDVSFFRDLLFGQKYGDASARARLDQHQREMVVEKRAINSTDSTGGEFVPPIWMQDEWIALARAGRPFANAMNRRPLPPKTDSINFPSVTTGSATAVQTDGGTVQSTDPATGSVTAAVQTIAGQVDLSRQLLDRSVPGMDEVLFDDLARDYATQLDVKLLSGTVTSAKGILQLSGTNAITYTDASPTGPELYPAFGQAASKISTLRFLPPDLVVMHPRRWYWLATQLDGNSRPLVTPLDAPGFNAMALIDVVGAENVVGRILGLPVLIDASVPTTNGASTNEDQIIVTRRADCWLFEDEQPQTRLYEEVLSGTLQIRAQVFGYYAVAFGRYPKAHAIVSGTGLAAPSGF